MKLTTWQSLLLSVLFTIVWSGLSFIIYDRNHTAPNTARIGGAYQHHRYQFDINGDTIHLFDENREVGIAIDSSIWKCQLGTLIVEDNN